MHALNRDNVSSAMCEFGSQKLPFQLRWFLFGWRCFWVLVTEPYPMCILFSYANYVVNLVTSTVIADCNENFCRNKWEVCALVPSMNQRWPAKEREESKSEEVHDSQIKPDKTSVRWWIAWKEQLQFEVPLKTTRLMWWVEFSKERNSWPVGHCYGMVTSTFTKTINPIRAYVEAWD